MKYMGINKVKLFIVLQSFTLITLIVLLQLPYNAPGRNTVLLRKENQPDEAAVKTVQYSSYGWQDYRGANISARVITEKDIKAFSELGGNLVRVTFASKPLLETQPPYKIDEEAFKKLDDILLWCEEYNVKAVIDPHTYPGFEKNIKDKDDVFWKDYKWQQYVVNLWEYIAKKYSSRGSVIAGYDLFNEPYIPNGGKAGTPADLNALYKRLVNTIREYDSGHAIILELPAIMTSRGKFVNYFESTPYMKLPEDDNLVLSVHEYQPLAFTHHDVMPQYDLTYYLIDFFKEKHWDENDMEKELDVIKKYSDEHKIPVYIGEFSATRWLGDSGNQYVQSVIEICEKYGWSWTYHSFREADVWDPEKSNTDRNDTKRYASTPRLEILKSSFERNTKSGQ